MIDVTLRDRIGDLEDGFDSLNSELGEGPGVTTETVGGAGGGGGGMVGSVYSTGGIVLRFRPEIPEPKDGDETYMRAVAPFCNHSGLDSTERVAAVAGVTIVTRGEV